MDLEPIYLGKTRLEVEAVKLSNLTYKEPTIDWLKRFLSMGGDVQNKLSNTSVKERLKLIDELGKVWREKLNSGKLDHLKKNLVKTTGYSERLIDMEFSLVSEVLNSENLVKLLDASLKGGLASLEGPSEIASNEYLMNVPAGPAFIISSGNSVIPPLIPTVVSLVVGNQTILKPSISNYLAVKEVFEGFKEVLNSYADASAYAEALLVSYFSHNSKALQYLLKEAPLGVVNYWGGDPGRLTVSKAVAENLNKPKLVVNGPLTGFAIVDEASANEANAEKLAFDIVLYDQQLCSSPTQAAFIGNFDSAVNFAKLLGKALDRVGLEFKIDLSEGHLYNIVKLRRALEYVRTTRNKVLYSTDPSNPWTLVVSEGRSTLAEVASSINTTVYERRRFLELITVNDLDQAVDLILNLRVNPAFTGVDKVQTVALAVSKDLELQAVRKLSRAGVYRIVPLGETYLRTPYEPYDGFSLPSVFTYSVYFRRGST